MPRARPGAVARTDLIAPAQRSDRRAPYALPVARADLDKQPTDVRRMFDAVAQPLRRHQRRALPRSGPAVAPATSSTRSTPAPGERGARPGGRHRYVEPAVRRRRRDGRAVRLLARDAPGRQAGTARACRSPPATAPGCRSPTTPSTRSRSRSGCATSSTRSPACARCGGSPGPVVGWSSASSATRPGRRSGRSYVEYLMKALPPIARAVSSSPDAYVYLAESIRAWPDQAGARRPDRRGRVAAPAVAQPVRRHRRPAPRHRLSDVPRASDRGVGPGGAGPGAES